MRVLVTGHTGFVGRNMFAQMSAWAPGDLHFLPPNDGFSLLSTDSIEASLSGLYFDSVVHLAGQSNVPASFADPSGTFDLNVTGTTRLLEVLQRRKFKGRFLYVSSGDVYGRISDHLLPVTELVIPSPCNPYAASKLAAEEACLAWARFGDFSVIIARPFNHIGRNQKTSFAVARYANLIARIAAGLEPPRLITGRLDVTRDFLDVRDVINAYIALLRHGQPCEIYNICSGVESRLSDIIQSLICSARIKLQCHPDASLYRPTDQLRMVGDASKLKCATGWAPHIPLSETIDDLLMYELGKYT